MSGIIHFDRKFIALARRYYAPVARVALGIVFFYFGLLKILGLSPADQLALGFAEKMGVGAIAHELFIILAFVECIIGILILIPRLTRLAILIMLAHMVIVCSPLLFYSEAVWRAPFVPNLEGQYIIKNIVLVALAFGLVANTQPLKHTR